MKKRLFSILALVIVSMAQSSCSRSQFVAPSAATKSPAVTQSLTVNPSGPSRTPTPSPSAAPTSLPPISRDAAKGVLTDFMQTNGGCALPCLLGLFPGQSGKNEINSFESYFRKVESPLDIQNNKMGIKTSGRGLRLQFWTDNTDVDISMDYYFAQNTIRQIIMNSGSYEYTDNGARILFENPEYASMLRYFSIASILDTYGPPSEILIAAFPDDPGHPSPPAQYVFSSVLVYSQKGFLVQYVSVRHEDQEHFIGCPAKSHIDVSTWDPRENLSVSDAVKYFSGVDSINSANTDYFRKVGEVTSYTLDSFYENFKSSREQQCIRTPKGLWQAP